MALSKPTYKDIVKEHLPYFDERTAAIDTLIIHASPSHTAGDLISAFHRNRTSTHYVIDRDGAVIECVPEEYRAWHAGVSHWGNSQPSLEKSNCLNCNSIGIELVTPTLGQTDFSTKQINTLTWLSSHKMHQYNIVEYNVVGHSDIAPVRKPDPGKNMPWEQLADKGVGFWFSLKDANTLPDLSTRQALKIIGYDVKDKKTTVASAYAFLRRFVPEKVSTPKKYLDVISNVFPQDPEKHDWLLKDSIINLVARAVARQVINLKIAYKRNMKYLKGIQDDTLKYPKSPNMFNINVNSYNGASESWMRRNKKYLEKKYNIQEESGYEHLLVGTTSDANKGNHIVRKPSINSPRTASWMKRNKKYLEKKCGITEENGYDNLSTDTISDADKDKSSSANKPNTNPPKQVLYSQLKQAERM